MERWGPSLVVAQGALVAAFRTPGAQALGWSLVTLAVWMVSRGVGVRKVPVKPPPLAVARVRHLRVECDDVEAVRGALVACGLRMQDQVRPAAARCFKAHGEPSPQWSLRAGPVVVQLATRPLAARRRLKWGRAPYIQATLRAAGMGDRLTGPAGAWVGADDAHAARDAGGAAAEQAVAGGDCGAARRHAGWRAACGARVAAVAVRGSLGHARAPPAAVAVAVRCAGRVGQPRALPGRLRLPLRPLSLCAR